MDFHHESEASRTTSLSLLVPILRVTLRIMVFLYLLICIISVAFALKSKIRHMMAISTTKINLAQDNVGKIYEFKGPVSSGQGIPSEIAKMFDLSKGRKIRKGTTFGSGGSRRSSSSGKKKSSGPDEIQYGAEDSDFDSLERSLMTKYGSKSVKESALEKGFVDEPFQKTPSRGKQKFEGFGASNPETGIKSKSTNTIKSKPRNDDIDNNGGFLRESRTMDRSGQPVSADTRKISTLGNQKSAGRNIDDLEQGFRQVAKKVEPKEISGRVNTNIVKKREALASQSKNNPFKMSKPFFKDDVIDNSNEVGVKVEDDIYEDEDDSIFEDDGDDGFDLDDLDSFYDDDNSEKKESKSIKQSQTKAPVAIRQELPRTGSKNSKSQASTKSASTSSDSRANRDVDSRFDVVAEPTYRLRSPPVAPPQTPEQQRVASEIKRKADEREVRQEAERKERKIQAKNDFIPFQFEDNQASVRSEEGMKLFSTTSTFQSLGISNEIILKNLEQEMHIGQPTRIQELAIPSLLEGKDAIIQAHTGSGKTLAFLLPLEKVIDTSKAKVQAVVLASSRELVSQIGVVAEQLFKGSGIVTQTLIGGANVQNQIAKMKTDRPHILIATPGRLAELVFKLKKVKLGMVRAVIVDEADQMLCEPYVDELATLMDAIPLLRRANMMSTDAQVPSTPTTTTETVSTVVDIDNSGSIDEDDNEDVPAPLVTTPTRTPTFLCLASATGSTNEAVQKFTKKYLRPDWRSAVMDSHRQLPPGITHGLISIPRMRALEMLRKFLNAQPGVTSAIIFVNDPHRVQVVCDQLLEMSLVAAPLHGDTSKEDRKEVLTRLRDGRLRLVVSTELAARGLDIPELSHVVNFDLPTDAQHYIHRAGRCGRAGRQGLVMNFANPETKFVVRRFGKQLSVKVQDCEIRDGQVFLKQGK